MTPGSFYFDPDGSGAAVFLGPTEARLMELLWRQGRMSGKQAQHHLRRDGAIAYTTVVTILTRLADKGMVERLKEGRSFLWQPLVGRDQFLADRIGRVRTCLARNFPQKM